ncbi:hypothetical protein [Fibrobacter sp.]|uniref:hypothetical protein n=1 Tax=Fibrobacter sp. TaxID=35828 RepID=UPI00388EF3C1
MKSKITIIIAILAMFANAQFFTNALANKIKQDQQQTSDTAKVESQTIKLDFEKEQEELINLCRSTWYKIHEKYTSPTKYQIRILTEHYAGEYNAPYCLNMYNELANEWGTSEEK